MGWHYKVLYFSSQPNFRAAEMAGSQFSCKAKINRAQFHGSANHRILRLPSRFPAYMQALNFCASLVSVECLVTRALKPKFADNPWNTLVVRTEFPASVSADSVLTVSRAIKLGPCLIIRFENLKHSFKKKRQVRQSMGITFCMASPLFY